MATNHLSLESLRRSLPGNRSTKPLICVMRRGLSLFPTLNLIDPLDTEKKSMNLQVNIFLHFQLKHLVILAETVVNKYWRRNAK